MRVVFLGRLAHGARAVFFQWSSGSDAHRSGRQLRHRCFLLFGFISRRYERGSLVVTTNLPFARWSEVFLDATAAAAGIDRIVHHATVLTTNGDSYRNRSLTARSPCNASYDRSGISLPAT